MQAYKWFDDPLVCRFRDDVELHGTFTHPWFLGVVRKWEPIFQSLEGQRARILEIGSFEGLSACYMLWRLRDATLTCIDTFAGSPEHVAANIDVSELRATFERNVALVDSSRVRTLVGDSRRVALELLAEGARFDLVFVDGSHYGLDVFVDAALSSQLLGDDGILVFDDYVWGELGEDALLRPGVAIDAFLTLVDAKYELLFADDQVGLRRVAYPTAVDDSSAAGNRCGHVG